VDVPRIALAVACIDDGVFLLFGVLLQTDPALALGGLIEGGVAYLHTVSKVDPLLFFDYLQSP
jgi:hypothetical protein